MVRNHRILDDLSSKLFPFHLSATSRFSRHCEKFQVPKWNCQRTEDFARNWPPTAGNGAAASFDFQQDANLRGGALCHGQPMAPNLTAIGTQTCQHHTMPLGLGRRRNKGVSTSPLRYVRSPESTLHVGLIAQRKGAAHSVAAPKGWTPRREVPYWSLTWNKWPQLRWKMWEVGSGRLFMIVLFFPKE